MGCVYLKREKRKINDSLMRELHDLLFARTKIRKLLDRFIRTERFIYLLCHRYLCEFQIVRDAQILSARMNHRGACACDNDTGDGAGVLCAIPHDYYANEIR